MYIRKARAGVPVIQIAPLRMKPAVNAIENLRSSNSNEEYGSMEQIDPTPLPLCTARVSTKMFSLVLEESIETDES